MIKRIPWGDTAAAHRIAYSWRIHLSENKPSGSDRTSPKQYNKIWMCNRNKPIITLHKHSGVETLRTVTSGLAAAVKQRWGVWKDGLVCVAHTLPCLEVTGSSFKSSKHWLALWFWNSPWHIVFASHSPGHTITIVFTAFVAVEKRVTLFGGQKGALKANGLTGQRLWEEVDRGRRRG